MSDATPASIEIRRDEGATQVVLGGDFTVWRLEEASSGLDRIPTGGDVVIDLSAVRRMDTAGAFVLERQLARLRDAGGAPRLVGASPGLAALLDTVSDAMPEPPGPPPPRPGLVDRLESLGRGVAAALGFFAELLGYLGLFLARWAGTVLRPRDFRLTSLVHHCQEVGLKAVPIVALMAFLIGVVLAFQGASQLRQFGAEVFVVDLIAISILRELGILLTAIIVAGRTASAYTAAIGSMKMREEVDAMRTLGIDPALSLLVPRVLALLLMLPILGLIANAAGLLGGAIMAWLELGISPAMFRTRLVEGTDVSHLLVGMIKAPFFALIIGIVGYQAGMKVESNAESLGRMTSNSVVASIFAVIVADAVFSVFFAQVGM